VNGNDGTRRQNIRARLVMAILALTFLFAASAQGASPLPDENIELPPELTTPDAKIDWIDQELKSIDEQIAPELAKPQARWSRPLIERLAARARGLRSLGDTLRYNAGRPPIRYGMTDADRALDRLQRGQESVERERRAKAEEKKQTDRADATGNLRILGEFGASAFAKRHPPLRTSSWPLKAGGTNTSHQYVDPDSDSNVTIEFEIDNNVIQRFSVLWLGESKIQPATLTRKREAFLRELLASMSSRADANAVVAYVKANQQLRYPNSVGMTAPEHHVGGLKVKAGVTGSSLIVVLSF
jgi:hypothetical protein